MSKEKIDYSILDSVARRAHYYAMQMIHIANHREDKQLGDPKVGGHPAASASALHILGALHLVVKSGFDHVAIKPHASPVDHSYNYLLRLLLDKSLQPLTQSEMETAMHGLRKYSHDGEPVFQSYHSAYDSDHHNFLPSGTVGIPPVNAGYLALAYRYAAKHGYETPKNAHFWALIGDSEFREGSLYEAMPDFGERELGNVTWIVDYNRQSLDGQRITNKEAMHGNDDFRLQRTAEANGWEVLQIRHGSLRKALFKQANGEDFKKFLEETVEDYELQALLLISDAEKLKKALLEIDARLKTFLSKVKSADLWAALRDLGGHDFAEIIATLEKSKENTRRPTLVIAHTLKGWGLSSAAVSGNHSSLPEQEEIDSLRQAQKISANSLFARFADASAETKFLERRHKQLLGDIKEQAQIKQRNQQVLLESINKTGEIPDSFKINVKLMSYPHTQWMLGQATAKLTRIGNTPTSDGKLAKGQKALTEEELKWRVASELFVSMAPDVGTSTNLNPAMDGKVFSATDTADYEGEFEVRDRKSPNLIPSEEKSDRFLRFDISECNVMSCVGSFGKMRDILGISIIPLMTVYDFFVKRALDQFFYNLYWKSSFLLVGTPSGVTLSPEGAQHGWKSDIQIPNQITWEPYFCQELDWILADAIRRHIQNDNEGRNGVFIRGVTRGADQSELMKRLKRQVRFKGEPGGALHLSEFPLEGATDEAQVDPLGEEQIYEQLKSDVLAGAYYLIDYQGYAGYSPGDNVVNIISMGAPTAEAIQASDELLKSGIYANVIVVTSSDLAVGIQAHESDYELLKGRLGLSDKLYLTAPDELNSRAGIVTLAGRRIPLVSVHDGEAGLLDNAGSIIGVKQISLAVRKHSKCGRPTDVYSYHDIDCPAIVAAVHNVLRDTALENVEINEGLLQEIRNSNGHTRLAFEPRTEH
ncbi:MAG: pyruvate dehydrogenase [Bdellovibrionales bacterium CG10_big_fil_rev_8_21_14_0_10_45_34]|nr:MAG: pyruvate dehydrogenase [Bdellovibrionales bacterium CG10_big_fil_rev_8_21_14_0_10_45_34]